MNKTQYFCLLTLLHTKRVAVFVVEAKTFTNIHTHTDGCITKQNQQAAARKTIDKKARAHAPTPTQHKRHFGSPQWRDARSSDDRKATPAASASATATPFGAAVYATKLSLCCRNGSHAKSFWVNFSEARACLQHSRKFARRICKCAP